METIRDFFGENNEILESAQSAMQDRIASPFYGYFAISFFLTNWKLFYAAFFLDQEIIFSKTAKLRSEYLYSLFPHGWTLVFDFFLYPFLITVLCFWIFPYATRVFYRKNIKNKIILRTIELQEMQKVTREEKVLVQQERQLIKEEVEKAKEEQKAIMETPEVVWDKEYQDTIKNLHRNNFKSVLNTIYESGGQVVGQFGIRNIPAEIVTYFHLNGIISFSDTNKAIIDLTEKGRYFAKKYLNSK